MTAVDLSIGIPRVWYINMTDGRLSVQQQHQAIALLLVRLHQNTTHHIRNMQSKFYIALVFLFVAHTSHAAIIPAPLPSADELLERDPLLLRAGPTTNPEAPQPPVPFTTVGAAVPPVPTATEAPAATTTTDFE